MMAYADHIASVDPWTFRTTSFLDPWFTDAVSRDTETLTRALQQSLHSSTAVDTPSDSNTNTNNSSSDTTTLNPDVVSPFLIPIPGLAAPAFGSNSFEIEATSQGVEVPAPKQRQRNGGAPGVSSRKVVKRKSRFAKRSQTTFFTADAANFRQMVQQVTGGSRLGFSPTENVGQILRPEPHRPGNRFPGPSNGSLVSSNSGGSSLAGIAGCLPTLDTSAFLLDRHDNQDYNKQQEQEQQVLMDIVGRGSVSLVASPPPPPLPVSLVEAFDPLGSFPPLDSWYSN